MNKKIFVALSSFAQYGREPVALLDKSGFAYTINPLGRRLVQDDIIEMGQGAHGIIAGVEPYDEDVLDRLPLLECISRCGVGIDNIVQQKAKDKNITICNTPDVVIQPVAELTIAMIFDLLRSLTFHTRVLRAKRWEKRGGRLLAGRKAGVLGLGRIGKRVAEILQSLGAKVCGSDLCLDQDWVNQTGVRMMPVDELLRSVDILTIHMAVHEAAPFQLGAKEIATMRDGALLVNVARARFVDEEALYAALRQGKLGGAALDVFSREPYAGKLCELDNVVLTPHVATLTKESRAQMEVQATENVIRVLSRR